MRIYRILAAALLLGAALFAQTAKFPTAIAGDADLKVAANRATSTLSTGINAAATSFTVASGTLFRSNSVVTIYNERISICNVAGNTLTVGYSACPNVDGRGFDGSVAAAHLAGETVSAFVSAWYHNAVKEEIKAIETALGTGMSSCTPSFVHFAGTSGVIACDGGIVWDNTTKTLQINHNLEARPAALQVEYETTAHGSGVYYANTFATMKFSTSVDVATSYYRAASYDLWLTPAASKTLFDLADQSVAAAAAWAIVKRGDGTVEGVSSALSWFEMHDAGNVTNWRAFLVKTPARPDGAGVLTNAFGLYIQDLKTAFVTNAYGIYQVGANVQNYFAGPVQSSAFTGPLTGNASTATALAANGANCSAGEAALGVDASGAAEGCWAVPAAGAPANAHYVTTQAEGGLSAEASLGALADNNIVAVDIAAGVATIRAALSSDVVAIFGGGTCSGYLKSDGTCDTPAGGAGTVTSVGLVGTANQITVTGTSPITTSGSWTLSFPAGGVTLPGTTTGTFSGNVAGNASTATALAANGANCSAGEAALGVDASGAAEGCWAVPAAGAPANAHYVTTQAEAGLSAETSLGALADNNIVAVDVAASVATPRAALSSDVVAIFGGGTCSGYLKSDGTCDTPAGDITAVGDCATGACYQAATANYVYAGPATGAAAPAAMRALVSADIPNNAADTSGTAAKATALASDPADCSANQFANAINASGTLSCSALTLAGAQFANQGTTVTVLHGNASGNPAFGAVVSADLAAANKTFIKSIALFDPVAGDSGRIQMMFPTAVTITRIACATKTATSTVTLNFEKRAAATPDTAGTAALSADLVADTNQQTSCASGCDVNTITSAAVAARIPLALTITSVANVPTDLRCHVEYTVD